MCARFTAHLTPEQVPPLSSWWKRFKPNRSTLPAAALATVFCGVSLLVIWTQPISHERDMNRYGEALSHTLAHSNAGSMLNQQRIELAVIANQVGQYPEIAGVAFYTASNEILVLSGNTDASEQYTASATLDDTLAGYVTVVLNATAFAPVPRIWSWLLSLLSLAVAPFLSLGILQLSARGNRSLPIVSVPEPPPPARQPSHCLTINLYNQLALGRDARKNAIADAMNLAEEICAIHPGIAVEIPERGLAILFDQQAVSGAQVVSAAFLIQRLLTEFETEGIFRCYLNEITCAGSPAEMQSLTMATLAEEMNVDACLTLAALAKPETVLLSEDIYTALTDSEKVWAEIFTHPLLEDVDSSSHTYSVDGLPPQQADLVDSQAMLILGFNQA